jgi:signal transduction histidine kinase
MKKVFSIKMMGLFSLFLLFILGSGIGFCQEKATPEEVIQKVREAAEYLSKTHGEAVSEFNNPNSKWVWKDTYIFVYKCKDGTVAAHPIKPKLVGKKLMGLKDIKGHMFFVELCEVSKKPKGGWVEYWWPKPGEKTPSRKISYMIHVKGTDYEVGAGIYDDTISVEELNNLIK